MLRPVLNSYRSFQKSHKTIATINYYSHVTVHKYLHTVTVSSHTTEDLRNSIVNQIKEMFHAKHLFYLISTKLFFIANTAA